MQKQFSIWRLLICLTVCVGLILGCFPTKADAVALEAALGIGVAACLILMTAGVVFNPKTVEDIQAIGQDFQSYMTQWGAENNKLQEVEEYIQDIVIINPFGAPDGSDDDDNNWSRNRTTVNLAWGLLAGISLWVSGFLLANRETVPLYDYTVKSYTVDSHARNMFKQIEPLKSYLRSPDKALIYAIHKEYLLGWFWDDDLILRIGLWENPYGHIDSGVFRSYSLSELTLVKSAWALGNDIPVFFDIDTAVASSYWSSQNVLSFNWNADAWNDVSGLSYLLHRKKASSWETYFSASLVPANFMPSGYKFSSFYKPYSSSSVVWTEIESFIDSAIVVGDVQSDLESGAISEEEVPLVDFNYADVLPPGKPVLESIQDLSSKFTSGELTVDEYLEMVQASDPNVGRPGWVKNIALSTSLTYSQGAAAEPLEVEVEVPEGCTAAYEWYRYGTDPDGNVYPVECLGTGPSFCPPTSELGTAYYYCRAAVTDAQGMVAYNYSTSAEVEVVPGTTVEPGTGTDSDNLTAEQIGSAVGDALKDAAAQDVSKINNTGNDVSQQLLNAIPDYSSRFLPAVRNLSDALGYTGTSCVLTMPAITVPAVSDLFSETRILDEQQINFEDFFNKMPEVLMKLTRALFDIAVVFFCLREFNHTIQQVMTGFKTPGDHWEEV